MTRKTLAQVSLYALVAACFVGSASAGCSSSPQPTTEEERVGSSSQPLTSTGNLQLEVLTNSCGASQVQDFFQVKNTGTTSIPLSQITIKLWSDDKTGQAMVGQINTGGCLSNASGCFHQVSGVKTSTAAVSPACGPDSSHQADEEITISTTDTTSLAPGQSWTNAQLALHLANFASFSPGTSDWYSPCLSGSSYAFDTHFAVYQGGTLLTSSPGVPPSCRSVQGKVPIPGEVPPGLGTTYPLVGPLPGSTQVTLAIGLPLTTSPVGQPTLESFIQSVSDPKSPTFRQYMTPATFAAAYGASAADYTALQQFASRNGLTVAGTHTNRGLLTVTGTAAAVESAFFVTLNLYKRPDGSTFYGPANAPSYSPLTALTNPITHITGLDSLAVPIPASGGSAIGGACANTGVQGFYGQDLRNLYFGTTSSCVFVPSSSPCPVGNPGCVQCTTNPNCGTNCPPSAVGQGYGDGQTVGLVELDIYNPANVTNYAQGRGLDNAGGIALCTSSPPATLSNITQVLVSSTGEAVSLFTPMVIPFPGYATNPTNESEAEFDIEMTLAMAPHANVVVYEEPTNGGGVTFNPATILADMGDNVLLSGGGMISPPPVIANSWVWIGSTGIDANVVQALETFAAQGQSFFQAAGDWGAYVANGAVVSPPDPIVDSPFITVVGGTTFQGNSNAPTHEITWNNATERPAATCGAPLTLTNENGAIETGACASAGGGGIVSALTIPGYQVGINTSGNPDLSTTSRMIPDVSMIADGLSAITASTGGVAKCTQGTSAAAVLWASYAAISNELSNNGSVGYANPELYLLGTNPANGAFNDIGSPLSFMTSNNSYSSVPASTSFQARTGYDLATGLGSPSPASCSLPTTLPTQSCAPGTAVSALLQGKNVTAYVPNGSYSEAVTGVNAVPLEVAPTGTPPAYGAVPPAFPIATNSDPVQGVINTCSGNSTTGLVVCTSNGTTVWTIDGTSPPASQTANAIVEPASNVTAGAFEEFSGGTCQTCNVTIDPIHNFAYLSVASANGFAAFQPVDLSLGAALNATSFLPLIPTNQQATSEDILVDPRRQFILSPIEGALNGGGPGDYQLVQLKAQTATAIGGGSTTPVVDFDPADMDPLGTGFDSAAEDCATGIALASDEETDNIFLADLTQVAFTNNMGANSTWSSGSASPGFGFFSIPELQGTVDGEGEGATSVVVVPGTHLALVSGEFGGNTFAVAVLPSTSGSGTPMISKYFIAQIPSPDGGATNWVFGHDPHTVTAYTSPNSGSPYAVFEDDVTQNGARTFLAVIDLQQLMAFSVQTATNSPVGFTVGSLAGSTCTSTNLATGVNPVGCVVRFVSVQ